MLNFLTSCATPPDIPVCTQITNTRGYCVHTVSSKEFEISEDKKFQGKTWWQIKPYMIYLPIDSWKQIKTFIIKICKKSGKCDGPNISSWERTINKIDNNLIKE